MSVRDTSREAFNDNADNFKTMGDRIVHYMTTHPGIHTRNELASAMRIPTATMSGRINDLVKKGRVIEARGRVACQVTGRNVRGVRAAA